MSTAERLDAFMSDWDHFGYMDADMSVGYFDYAIKNMPETIIEGLLDIIEELQEELENV